ncbi:Hypothetical predicted protein [Paramuricea clavata]|uniref:Uncharacterized protein n=1 Tax=Paramuricea clavata TaxID=317549 RepID=A0A6S7GM30_PARCT|nr:Hypothetical predicted protein [Paramuricea clavata]
MNMVKRTASQKNTKETEKPEDVGKASKPAEKLPGKKKSNIEKNLDIVFDKMKQTADTDFEKYQKLEEQRIAEEHEFIMKQINLEKEMRKEEREHEFRMMQLLKGHQAYSAIMFHYQTHCTIQCACFCRSK